MTNYDTLKEYEEHKEPLPSYNEYKRLQEQLNEAQKIMKELIDYPSCGYVNQRLANEYLEKWGVK